MRQWRFDAARNPTIPAAPTPVIHLGRSSWSSATPLWSGQICRPPSVRRKTYRKYSSRETKSCSLGSTSNGCIKILETIWMTESQRIVIVNLAEKACLFAYSTLRRTVWKSWEEMCLNPLNGAWLHTSSDVESQASDCFSVDHPVTRPSR